MRLSKKSLVLFLTVASLVGGAIFANSLVNKQKQATGTIPVKKVVPGIGTEQASASASAASSPASNSVQSSDKTQNTVSATDNQSQEVAKPFGTFVSNHHPKLSGDNSQLTIQSVCSSTPGAKCLITFSKDGVVKSLPEQVVGSDGSTLWEWNIKGAGITEGIWSIKAIARIGDKTSETTDSLNLEVSQ